MRFDWAGCKFVPLDSRGAVIEQPPVGYWSDWLKVECTNPRKELVVSRVMNEETLILSARVPK